MWSFLTVFLLGSTLRVIELFRPVRYDEAYTYLNFAMRPLYQALSDYSVPNNHLFHTLLVFLSTHLFGNTLTALRLPALIGGLLMMPAVFVATAALYNRYAAIVATAFVACSPPFIAYSVNARGYTWQAVFLLLMIWFASRIPAQQDARPDWVGLVLAAVGAIYTIPTSVLPVAGILFWLVLLRRQGGSKTLLQVVRQMTPALLSILVLVLWLYLPPLVVSGPAFVFKNRFIQPMGMEMFLAKIPHLGGMTWNSWNDGVPLEAQLLLSAACILGLVAHRKIGRQSISLTAVVIVISFGFAFARTTFGYSRVWLFLWFFVLMTAGAGMALVLSRRWLITAFSVVFAVFVGVVLHKQNVFLWSSDGENMPDIAIAAEWIDHHLDSRDRVVTSELPGPPLRYLLHQKWPKLEPQMDFGANPRRIVAVIAKQPMVDDGHARDPRSWNSQEVVPAAIMFPEFDRASYSEPRVVEELAGVTIWEAWNVSVETAERR